LAESISKLTYTVPEFGRILGIGRNLAYEAVRRGEVRAVRLGHRWVVPKLEVQRLLEARPAQRNDENPNATVTPPERQ
jgi:excisionase family DNA binding protein